MKNDNTEGKKVTFKNLPKEIYLLVGEGAEPGVNNFNDCIEVAWCTDKVNESDPKYVLAPPPSEEGKGTAEEIAKKHISKFYHSFAQLWPSILAAMEEYRSLADTPSEKLSVGEEVEALRAWKAEAIRVMPDYQRIGHLIGVPLGQSVHDKIVPYLERIPIKEGGYTEEQMREAMMDAGGLNLDLEQINEYIQSLKK